MKRLGTKQGWGNMGRGFKMTGPRTLIPVAALAAACSSLLGIEDVNPSATGGTGAGAGSGGASATGGKGGTGGASGGTAGKGAGGATGGATGGDAGSGTGGKGGGSGGKATGGSGGSGGDSGEGGEGNEPSTGGSAGKGGGAGSGGSAGTGGMPGDTTVRGKLVNHLQHAIPNTQIWVGEAMTTTDSDGEFEVEDVPATYDVKLVITYTRYGNAGPTYGWVYEGLTRRDPTIQVLGGAPIRDSNFSFMATNPPVNTSETRIALGSEYGKYTRETAGAVGLASFSWYGPATITAMAHGLVWTETNGLPTSYTDYTVSSAPFAFNEGGNTPWALTFGGNAPDTDTISGSVVATSTADRTNAVFVRFSSGALIKVAEQTGANATANYSYLVPTLPNATVTVMASEGTSSFGAAAVAHRSGVTGGQTTPALTIPTPASLIAPVDGTQLTANTMFSWNGEQDTYVFHAESNSWFEGMYVVTTRKTISLPTFPNGFTFRAQDDGYWRVETHGDAETVDDLAGPNGYLDSFGPWGDEPEGPRRDAGSFSISAGRGFIAP